MEKMTPLNQIIYVARDRSHDFVRDSQARTLILSSMHFGKWNLIRASESLSLSLSLITHRIWKWITDDFILFFNFISHSFIPTVQ